MNIINHDAWYFIKVSLVLVSALLFNYTSNAIADEGDVTIRIPADSIRTESLFEASITADGGERALGAFQLNVTYDTNLVIIDKIKTSEPNGFGGNLFYNLDSLTNGQTNIAAFQRQSLLEPKGEVTAAVVVFNAVGPANSMAEIGLNIELLCDTDGQKFTTKVIKDTVKITSVSSTLDNIPFIYDLQQNFPNPFNPGTTVKYQIPKIADLKIYIYDILGREVKTLVNMKQIPGYYTITWDGKNNFGQPVSTGVYFIAMATNDFHAVRKVMVIK